MAKKTEKTLSLEGCAIHFCTYYLKNGRNLFEIGKHCFPGSKHIWERKFSTNTTGNSNEEIMNCYKISLNYANMDTRSIITPCFIK